MHTPSFATPSWSTSSFGHTAGTSSVDLSTLREHLNLCQGLNGRWFAVQCAADRLNGFVTARFVTTLAVAALFIGVASWLT